MQDDPNDYQSHFISSIRRTRFSTSSGHGAQSTAANFIFVNICGDSTPALTASAVRSMHIVQYLS